MSGEGDEKVDYQDTLAYLFGLQRFGIKLGLANIQALLQKLGNPHRQFPAVHIAGSNGKGSTAAFLASILNQAGYRVGLYTSPHLVDFNERIQVERIPIPTDHVVRLTLAIREAAEEMKKQGELWKSSASYLLPENFDPEKANITFFEFTTVMAFLYFREKKVDLAVLETGMGGRLDATNVIDPLLSLITNLTMEHQQYLGRNLMEITGEKAGIIKPRRPLLTTATQTEVLSFLGQRCQELNSPFYRWGKDFFGKKIKSRAFHFQGRSHRWLGLSLGLLGEHQFMNASLALAAAEVMIESGYSIEESHLRRGLEEVEWPGRLELIGKNPRILLDGAHNPEATRTLKKALQEDFPRRRLILILGIMADKDIAGMMADLVPLADAVILTRPHLERAASLKLLRSQPAIFQKPVKEIEDVSEALSKALAEAGEEDLILVTGSLYTVGEARSYLLSQGMVSS